MRFFKYKAIQNLVFGIFLMYFVSSCFLIRNQLEKKITEKTDGGKYIYISDTFAGAEYIIVKKKKKRKIEYQYNIDVPTIKGLNLLYVLSFGKTIFDNNGSKLSGFELVKNNTHLSYLNHSHKTSVGQNDLIKISRTEIEELEKALLKHPEFVKKYQINIDFLKECIGWYEYK